MNRRLAKRLQPLLKPDETLWIHDYHLMPFTTELRKLGVNNPIGFFLHIPFPTPEISSTLPPRETLLSNLCQYDLLGFQTEKDRLAFPDNVAQVTLLESQGNKQYEVFNNDFTSEGYPIGIDPDSISEMASGSLPPKMATMKRNLDDFKISSLVNDWIMQRVCQSVSSRMSHCWRIILSIAVISAIAKLRPPHAGM